MSYGNIVIPPGETLKEAMETRGIGKEELAKNMNISESFLESLLNGEAKLTNEVALRLEAVIGIPAYFWRNLEAKYRQELSKERMRITINGK